MHYEPFWSSGTGELIPIKGTMEFYDIIKVLKLKAE